MARRRKNTDSDSEDGLSREQSEHDGSDHNSDDGENSDSEIFLSARGGGSDWYAEVTKRSSSGESPMQSARSEQFWTPRSEEFWTPRGDGVPPPGMEGSFKPNLMPKEFEKIFSKTRHGRHKEVEALLAEGAPVDGQDPYGNTVLHTACQNGNKRIVKACLRRGCDTNAQNIRGHTPLHFCFAYGYAELGGYLMEKGGADESIRNHFGLTCREGLGLKTPLPE
mmetsp:Transcript_6042/g.12241  ORF Transcript_6042/g.12241 Transcript_6042/m.12241 type:complete len:223 (-) Transcript_6042:159-827(-)